MGGGCLGLSAIVYMSSGMFRGKEFSNRIELSRLVQDLLNFGVLVSLQLWGWGWLGVPPHTCTCMHMHTHAHTCMHGKRDNFMQMAAFIGFLGNPWEFPMMSYTCACVWGHPLTTPTPIHPSPIPQGGPQNQSKFNST